MSIVTNPIHAPTPAQHRLNHRAVDAGIKGFAGGKVDTSAVPTNQVEATWQDALDMVNPLQQIPVVGDIYRAATGEKISGLSRVAGGFLWGGFTGGFAAAFSAAYAAANNDQSPGEQMVAALFGTETQAPDTAPTMLAETAPNAVMPNAVTPSAATPAAAMPPVASTAPAAIASLAAAPELPAPQAAATEAPAVPATLNATLQQGTAETASFIASLPPEQTPTPTKTAGLTITEMPGTPLRERLNRKNPGSVTPNAKPLDQYVTGWTAKTGSSYLSQIPAQAATLAAAQKQNLQLLQGVADIPPTPAPAITTNTAPAAEPAPALPSLSMTDAGQTTPAATASSSAAGTILAPIAPGQHNPLPLQLVQDMMQQALDKYQALHAPAATTDGFGLQ